MKYPLLVTSYNSPDLDGTGGVIAYAELLASQGRQVVAGLSGTLHPEAQHILERLSISTPPEIDPRTAKEIVLIDTSIIQENDLRLPLDRVIEIIDHRSLHEGHRFPNAKLQIELVGAAATLVAERWHAAKKVPSQESAILLYAAIASNTVNWKATVTTPRDHAMATWLTSIADIPSDLVQTMFEYKSELSGDKLHSTIFNDFSWKEVGGKELGIAQLEILHAEALIRSRANDLAIIVKELREAHPIHEAFVSAIDIEKEENWFFATDKELQTLLSAALNITFIDNIAHRPGILMRKQIGPMLRAWHTKQPSS